MGQKRPKLNAFGMPSNTKRHVRLHHYMLESQAWQSLSPHGRALFIEIWQRFNGQNNGAISYGHREAEESLKVSKNLPKRFFDELESKGFIVATRRGHFQTKGGPATTWRLTTLDCGNAAASKEFMRWRR